MDNIKPISCKVVIANTDPIPSKNKIGGGKRERIILRVQGRDLPSSMWFGVYDPTAHHWITNLFFKFLFSDKFFKVEGVYVSKQSVLARMGFGSIDTQLLDDECYENILIIATLQQKPLDPKRITNALSPLLHSYKDPTAPIVSHLAEGRLRWTIENIVNQQLSELLRARLES